MAGRRASPRLLAGLGAALLASVAADLSLGPVGLDLGDILTALLAPGEVDQAIVEVDPLGAPLLHVHAGGAGGADALADEADAHPPSRAVRASLVAGGRWVRQAVILPSPISLRLASTMFAAVKYVNNVRSG